MIRALVGMAAAVILLTSCATHAKYQNTVATSAVRDISGSPVFVYSFLDLWTPSMGTELVESTDRQMTRRFAEHSIQVSIIHLYNSGHILRDYQSRGNDFTGRRERMSVPIEEIVDSHRDEEQALGAHYRLIGLPQNMNSSGGTAQWMLIDIASDQVVWSTTMQVGFGDFRGDSVEDVDRSYAAIVDGLIEEMQGSGLLASTR